MSSTSRITTSEWGRPVQDDQRLFEKLCLEGFQAGLSWLTILRKRENFRQAFNNFDLEDVASFSDGDVERLLSDAGIVRHRGKIEATINNAARALELIETESSLSDFSGPLRPIQHLEEMENPHIHLVWRVFHPQQLHCRGR